MFTYIRMDKSGIWWFIPLSVYPLSISPISFFQQSYASLEGLPFAVYFIIIASIIILSCNFKCTGKI